MMIWRFGGRVTQFINELMTKVFVEQPLSVNLAENIENITWKKSAQMTKEIDNIQENSNVELKWSSV